MKKSRRQNIKTPKNRTIFEIKNLSKHFGGLKAVNDCSFKIAENSITALIGPNGAGKTTLFDLISGFLQSDSGEIEFKGIPITHHPPHKRARLGITRTFQAIRIFPELSVIDNILVAFPDNREKIRHLFMPLKKHRTMQRERAMELLRRVNLERHASHYAAELSYGQQKLLEILRAIANQWVEPKSKSWTQILQQAEGNKLQALASNASERGRLRSSRNQAGMEGATQAPIISGDFFLLDEPAAGVNRTMLKEIVSLIQFLKKQGKTILLVEHDMPFVMGLCEKIIVMDRGKEIAIGKPKAIQQNPKVLEAYLGKGSTINKQ